MKPVLSHPISAPDCTSAKTCLRGLGWTALWLALLLAVGTLGRPPAALAHGPRLHGTGLVGFDKPVAAPPFTLPTVAGAEVSLAALRGRTVVLNFWATWCPPCVREMPSLERLSKALAADGVTVLAVSLDAGGLAQVQPFVARLGLSLPIALDPLGDVGDAYGARDLPVTFVLDAQGRVVAAAKGERHWDGQPMIDYLRELARTKPRA